MENDLASDREISVESDVVGAGEIEMKSPDTKQCIESFFDDHNMGFKHSEMRNCTGFLCSQRYEGGWKKVLASNKLKHGYNDLMSAGIIDRTKVLASNKLKHGYNDLMSAGIIDRTKTNESESAALLVTLWTVQEISEITKLETLTMARSLPLLGMKQLRNGNSSMPGQLHRPDSQIQGESNTIKLHSQKTDYYRHQGVCPAVPPPPNPTRLHWKSPSQHKMCLTNSLPRMMSTTHPNNKDVASVLW
ncbi:hypothetical protein F2Q70_00003276 [Brassica cretica]|uniref:Uncharacterized protein n=1 Tax=Brassica cretica TaxID=69181 RepID=A0A8S9IRJ0_BRACR|nr:hypothetical protein F2Q70_00003276 [Brassica cretica]